MADHFRLGRDHTKQPHTPITVIMISCGSTSIAFFSAADTGWSVKVWNCFNCFASFSGLVCAASSSQVPFWLPLLYPCILVLGAFGDYLERRVFDFRLATGFIQNTLHQLDRDIVGIQTRVRATHLPPGSLSLLLEDVVALLARIGRSWTESWTKIPLLCSNRSVKSHAAHFGTPHACCPCVRLIGSRGRLSVDSVTAGKPPFACSPAVVMGELYPFQLPI